MSDDIRREEEGRLGVATAALREVAVDCDPPAEVIARAERIPRVAGRRAIFSRGRIAAGVALIFVVLSIVLVVQHSATTAFAEVAEAVGKTHTFTAIMHSEDYGEVKMAVKNSLMRIENKEFITISNLKTGQTLTLALASRRATTRSVRKTVPLDLYTLLSEHKTETEKSLGERVIQGKKAHGLLMTRPELPDFQFTLWVDPETRLPIQVEMMGTVLTDLKFDVPLDDAIFSMTAPAGYAVAPVEGPAKYAGQVTDEKGKPVANVKVVATRHFPHSMQYIAQPTETGRDGRFEIEGDGQSPGVPVRLNFYHADFLYRRMEGVELLSSAQCADLHVRLEEGVAIGGRAVDVDGKPMNGAMVQVSIGEGTKVVDAYDYRKTVKTDGEGKFEVRGLLAGVPLKVRVMKTDAGWPVYTGEAGVDGKGGSRAIEITLRPVELPEGKVVHDLFGMKLVEIDDALRKKLFLDASSHLLIVDPGPNSKRLNIGTLHPLDAFFMVNTSRIGTFKEFAGELLATCQAQKKAGRATFLVRVVYNYHPTADAGSNTQYMRLDENDLAELQKAVTH